jgi:rRNA maturation RNase YbeY
MSSSLTHVGKLLIESTQRKVVVDMALLRSRTELIREWSGVAHCDLSLTVVGDAAMRTLNTELRGVAKPTDVLSVALHRHLKPHKPVPAIAGVFDLGDLYLCAPYIARHVKRKQIPCLQSYMARLVCHGLLHLRGFTHDRDDDFAAMSAQERALVARLQSVDPTFRFSFDIEGEERLEDS